MAFDGTAQEFNMTLLLDRRVLLLIARCSLSRFGRWVSLWDLRTSYMMVGRDVIRSTLIANVSSPVAE